MIIELNYKIKPIEYNLFISQIYIYIYILNSLYVFIILLSKFSNNILCKYILILLILSKFINVNK